MIIIVVYYYYVKNSIEKSIEWYKTENPTYNNFRFENIPKKRLLEICTKQWGLFLPYELGNYIMTTKICPSKPRKQQNNKYIVDDDYDMVENYPIKQLLSKLKSIESLKKCGNLLPSQINDDICFLRCDSDLNKFLEVWNEWCLKMWFQNKRHYCTSWVAMDGKPDSYSV